MIKRDAVEFTFPGTEILLRLYGLFGVTADGSTQCEVLLTSGWMMLKGTLDGNHCYSLSLFHKS